MARLVAAFGSSHSVMLTATLQDWQTRFRERDKTGHYFDRGGNPCSYDDLLARAPADAAALVSPVATAERFAQVQAGMVRLGLAIEKAGLDALIVIGDDQHELFGERHMPSIGVYWGDTIRNGLRQPLPASDWYGRAQMMRLEEWAERRYPCHRPLALHLIDGLGRRGFDVSAMSDLPDGACEGHAFSFVHRRYMSHAVVPIVPVFLNTFYPPNQPSPARCLALGQALRNAVEDMPDDLRIGIMASGGLSHFQAEEDLDRAVIEALQERDTGALAGLDPRRLQSGSSEIRSWIALGGAVGGLSLEWVSYTPGYRSPALTGTGLCFAVWQ